MLLFLHILTFYTLVVLSYDKPICCVEVIPNGYVPVFGECLSEDCHCTYSLQGECCQLLPCRFVSKLLNIQTVTDDDLYVITGVCRGFRIIDKNCETSYKCENYKSITVDYRVE